MAQQVYGQQAQMMVSKSPNGEFAVSALGAPMEEMGTCLLSCCCPCVVYGQNQQALNNKDSWFVDCFIYYCAAQFGFHSCLGCVGRQNIRSQRQINGSSVNDCCIHFCCTPCALTQERIELQKAGKQF
ncbi:hypothetical protein HDV01_006086 [Terramyces sp. JEL0728]|nr:hypothetical protein HDV01_006086 [Terramyces sp. JEL0728]